MDRQAILRQEGNLSLGASPGWERLNPGMMQVIRFACSRLRGIVAMVRPMSREYPKCRDGIAANLFVKRLSVQIEPCPLGPWTVSTNLRTSIKAQPFMKERDIPITSSQFPNYIIGCVCAEKARRHAWPEREDNECKQITESHCPSSRLI